MPNLHYVNVTAQEKSAVYFRTCYSIIIHQNICCCSKISTDGNITYCTAHTVPRVLVLGTIYILYSITIQVQAHFHPFFVSGHLFSMQALNFWIQFNHTASRRICAANTILAWAMTNPLPVASFDPTGSLTCGVATYTYVTVCRYLLLILAICWHWSDRICQSLSHIRK